MPHEADQDESDSNMQIICACQCVACVFFMLFMIRSVCCLCFLDTFHDPFIVTLNGIVYIELCAVQWYTVRWHSVHDNDCAIELHVPLNRIRVCFCFIPNHSFWFL